MEWHVQYPSNTDWESAQNSGLIGVGPSVSSTPHNGDSQGVSTLNFVLSLDDGRWQRHSEVHQELAPICPSKVADPRPGPASPSPEGKESNNSYQHLHVPVRIMEDFLRLARSNTERNLETCGVLAGSLKNRGFHITTLIIPKQEFTSDSCQTLKKKKYLKFKIDYLYFPWIGFIHPTQTCFMSSIYLHTHYSYQIMLPEAVAIVMAPRDESTPH